VTGHPEDKDITPRRLTLSSKKIDVLGRFLGGQGTLNVPCWALDGGRIAFVTYQAIPCGKGGIPGTAVTPVGLRLVQAWAYDYPRLPRRESPCRGGLILRAMKEGRRGSSAGV
jgi:hypothetical protein